MKYGLEARSVAMEGESIKEKHDRFLKSIADIPPPWGAAIAVPAPDPGAQLCTTLSASKVFGKGVRGSITYQYRRQFDDDASQDDWIDLTFNPSKIDYRLLVYDYFDIYVKAFDAYTASISDEEFIYTDYEEKKHLRFDKRSSIFRISPISFFKSDLTMRAFGIPAREVVKRLAGKVEDVREGCGGVFIVLTSAVLPTAELDKVCAEAKACLSR